MPRLVYLLFIQSLDSVMLFRIMAGWWLSKANARPVFLWEENCSYSPAESVPVKQSGLQKTLLKTRQLQMVGYVLVLLIMPLCTHWWDVHSIMAIDIQQSSSYQRSCRSKLEEQLVWMKDRLKNTTDNKVSLSLSFVYTFTNVSYKNLNHVCV